MFQPMWSSSGVKIMNEETAVFCFIAFCAVGAEVS
jgi:hypothetical protein